MSKKTFLHKHFFCEMGNPDRQYMDEAKILYAIRFIIIVQQNLSAKVFLSGSFMFGFCFKPCLF